MFGSGTNNSVSLTVNVVVHEIIEVMVRIEIWL